MIYRRHLASLLSAIQTNWQVYTTGSVVGRAVAAMNKTRRVLVLQQFDTDGSTNWWPVAWHCCGDTYHCCETLIDCLINNFLRQFWRNVRLLLLTPPFIFIITYTSSGHVRYLQSSSFTALYYEEFFLLSESVDVLLHWVQEFLNTDTMP